MAPANQYAADGDYTVGLTVTTVDGRSASTTGTVHMATHDVSITAFRVPATGRVGQNRGDHGGGPERALRRDSAGGPDAKRGGVGFEAVARVALPVPVRARATRFDLTYTFTDGDAAQGKVSFKAVATTVGARDALPADNTVIAPITTPNADRQPLSATRRGGPLHGASPSPENQPASTRPGSPSARDARSTGASICWACWGSPPRR